MHFTLAERNQGQVKDFPSVVLGGLFPVNLAHFHYISLGFLLFHYSFHAFTLFNTTQCMNNGMTFVSPLITPH